MKHQRVNMDARSWNIGSEGEEKLVEIPQTQAHTHIRLPWGNIFHILMILKQCFLRLCYCSNHHVLLHSIKNECGPMLEAEFISPNQVEPLWPTTQHNTTGERERKIMYIKKPSLPLPLSSPTVHLQALAQTSEDHGVLVFFIVSPDQGDNRSIWQIHWILGGNDSQFQLTKQQHRLQLGK